ncbi:MAG: alanine--tRNA ligase, partial [Novosphingobium sp.]|nr:alanine--tRNA ligase [Novosphingobium sp.]
FGEKYGDEVRVVTMGRSLEGASDKPYSMELCGGTHVARTGDIGLIALVNEGAVAAGVRRVEALTGDAARHYLAEQDRRVRAIAGQLKVATGDIEDRLSALLEERRKLEKELADAKRQLALGGGASAGQDISAGAETVAGVSFMGRAITGVDAKQLKGIVDEMKGQIGSGVVTLVGVNDEGRAAIVVGVTEDLTARISAVDLVRVGSEALGGKGGGGRPDMAQAGGPDGSKADEALAAVRAGLEAAAANV